MTGRGEASLTDSTATSPTDAAARNGGSPPSSITAGELARVLSAKLVGADDVILDRIEPIDHAGAGALTFIRTMAYAASWPGSNASAALVSSAVPFDGHLKAEDGTPGRGRALLFVPDADLALIRILEVLAGRPEFKPGVHASAVVDATATIDESASVGANCVVGPRCVIGPKVRLEAGVLLGHGVSIGTGSILHPGVKVLDRCKVGAECILHSGVVIGGDGFGYHPRPDGRGVIKIPHIGAVSIGDQVEIGANSCVDRAKFGDTVIGAGTKIDNLVQIGHGCRVGRSCIICGHVGLAGSVSVGDGVMLGGKVGVADNVKIGPGAKIAAYAAVSNDVPAGAIYMGQPAGPASEWKRNYAALRNLGKILPRIKRATRELDAEL